MSNAYTYKPPCTVDDLREMYVECKMTQTEIAKRLGTTQKVIWNAMRKAGITSRVAAKREQRGEKNSSWRGGRVLQARSPTRPGISDGGYWYIHAPWHPNAKKGGYVAEHIAVASKRLGRALVKGEVVHHVDLNKHNNDARNLAVGSRKRHAEWHNQLEVLAVGFMRRGWISFSDERGYELVTEVPQCPSRR